MERQCLRPRRRLQGQGRCTEPARRRALPTTTDSTGSRPSRPASRSPIRSLARQIDVLYLLYLEKQVDPELLQQITAKANAIEKAFNAYRANVDGRQITDSEVRKVLKESRDSGRAQGRLGREQGGRPARRGRPEGTGQAAQRGGAASWDSPTITSFSFTLNEQSQEQVLTLFDELDALTREPFRKLKVGDRREAGRAERRLGRRAAPLALSRPVLPGSRRRSSPPISTRSTPRPTSSSSAATSTPASACRSTT